jgi:hypothetical protein
MDYETIKIEDPADNSLCCCIKGPTEIGWDCGEQKEIRLPIFGKISLDDGITYLTPADFLERSNSKYAKMVLQNFRGEIVDTQVAKAISDFEFSEDGTATCYYIVDAGLSEKLRAGVYNLYVYLMNTLPATNNKPERTIFNLMVTNPEGIKITIY